MDKKTRTGLQSKISHIFAGVPMPKRKKLLSKHPKPEEKDETSEMMPLTEDVVIEKNVDEQLITNPVLEEDITEVSFSQETSADQPHDLQRQAEQEQAEPESLESDIEQKSEDELTEEQFTIVSEPDFTEQVSQRDEKEDKTSHEREIPDSEHHVVISGDEISLESLITPHPSEPLPKDSKSQTQQPSKEDSKKEKPPVEKVPPVPPVKEPVGEKPEISSKQKLETPGMPDTMRTPKPLVSKVPRLIVETQKAAQISRKASLKSRGKLKKSQTVIAQPRQKAMVVIFIVFSIILVLVLLKNFGFFASSSDNSETTEQTTPSTTSGKNTVNLTIDWVQPPVYPDEIRDPMELASDTLSNDTSKKDGFIVNGISYVEGRWRVLIGTDFYGLGDQVKDYNAEIINITDNNVEFRDSDGKTWMQVIGEQRKN